MDWKAQSGRARAESAGLPAGRSTPACLAWLICVLLVSWLWGREEEPGATGVILFVVTSVLGLASGVVLVIERHTRWIFLAVPTPALLGTLTLAIVAVPAQSSDGFEAAVAFKFLILVLGTPVVVGAFGGAMWRLFR